MRERGLVPLAFIPDEGKAALTLAIKLVQSFTEGFRDVQIAHSSGISLGKHIQLKRKGHIVYGKPQKSEKGFDYVVIVDAIHQQTREPLDYCF